eukprot:3845286-Pleurochrysis_carterae.AAC.1
MYRMGSGQFLEPRVLRAEIPRSARRRDSGQRRLLLGIYSGTRRAIAKYPAPRISISEWKDRLEGCNLQIILTRGGDVCGLLTSMAAQREREANEGVESKTQGARERQGLESTAARSLRECRSVSCAKAACNAVESREAGRIGHPPPAQIR